MTMKLASVASGPRVTLSGNEIQHLLFCAAEVRRGRSAGKIPGNPQAPWLIHLIRRLEIEVALSHPRQDGTGGESSSKHEELVGTRETATLLGWTIRQVQRRAADLEGRKLASGQLVFPAHVVHEYAESLNNARTVA
ncbi:hypothetical protein NWT09_22135 [Mycolicibacterium sp. jd]|uniref:hypothetical protein n=1 Tax=unclassified Mycolicibacterium TaxID=2636767 RepID=UPI00351BE26A